MCERYVVPEQAQAEREFRPQHPWWKFAPSFNVAPGRNVPVVRSYQGATEGVMLRWGLIPDWAQGDAKKSCVVAARAADVGSAEAARGAWMRGQRCILPVAGFYHWQLTTARYRQPYFAHLPNRAVFGIAAIWDRSVNEDEDDVLESCAPITISPKRQTAGVADAANMPVILRNEDYETWLHGSPVAAQALLRVNPHERLAMHAVSPRVNALKYDDVQLIAPAQAMKSVARQCA